MYKGVFFITVHFTNILPFPVSGLQNIWRTDDNRSFKTQIYNTRVTRTSILHPTLSMLDWDRLVISLMATQNTYCIVLHREATLSFGRDKQLCQEFKKSQSYP